MEKCKCGHTMEEATCCLVYMHSYEELENECHNGFKCVDCSYRWMITKPKENN